MTSNTAPTLPKPPNSEAAAGMQRVAKIVTGHPQGRQQAADPADQQREEDHERHDARGWVQA